MSYFQPIQVFPLGSYVKSGGSTETRATHKYHASVRPRVTLPTVSFLDGDSDLEPADYHAGRAGASAAGY